MVIGEELAGTSLQAAEESRHTRCSCHNIALLRYEIRMPRMAKVPRTSLSLLASVSLIHGIR